MLTKVQVENGLVEGLPAADPRITSFKGIPFAAPPVGENRWRAPQPAKNWDGVLKAYEFAPISMQHVPGDDPDNIYTREWNVDPEIEMSEDSLISMSGRLPTAPMRSCRFSSGISAAASRKAIPRRWNLTASASPAAVSSS